MGVTGKFARERHDFQTISIFRFFVVQKSLKSNFCKISKFKTKLGAFNTNQNEQVTNFSPADGKNDQTILCVRSQLFVI